MLLIAVLGTALLQGAGPAKIEPDPRAQLAETQAALAAAQKDRDTIKAQLAAAVKDRAALAASIAKLTAAGNAAGRQQAGTAAQQESDVRDARETSAANAVAAQDAVINAVTAARLQGDALARLSSQNDLATHAIYATLITSVFGFMSLLASFAWKAFTDNRDHRWLVQSTHKTEMETALHRVNELARIDEVGHSADAAYKEANTVNLKIASIGVKMADGQPLSSDSPLAPA